MADSTLNQFVATGTTAERLAFTPTPPTPPSGPDPGYTWFDTDDSTLYAYDFGAAAWAPAVTGGAGTVTNTGTLTANALILGNGGVDVAPMASLGTTTTVLHGNAAGAPTFDAIVSADLPTAVKTRAVVQAVFSGSSLAGGQFIDCYVPYACTITAATCLGDVSGDVVFDVKVSNSYATIPTVSIVASAPPTLSGAAGSQDTTLTGWTTSVAAGSRVRVSVTSTSTLATAELILTGTV